MIAVRALTCVLVQAIPTSLNMTSEQQVDHPLQADGVCRRRLLLPCWYVCWYLE